MASLPPLGEVAVDVTARLDKLLHGFGEANRASASFDRSMNQNVARSAATATRQTNLLGGSAQRLSRDFRPAIMAADRFGASVAQAAGNTQRGAAQVNTAAASIRRTLLASAATIAAAFGAREIMTLADNYTSFTNRIRSAGVEGRVLAERQQQLFDIAQRYGVELGAVGELFGRVAQAQNDLGASTSQIMLTVEGAAAAVRVYGASTQEQAGAIRQLSQLLGNAKVQMQEFNSLNDGARPLLVAVATGIERFGGSVSRLRAEIMRGGFETKEFFEGLQRGLPAIIDQANRMPLTLGASFQILNNALGQYIGQTNEAWSATQRIGAAIQALAANLDTVMPILALIVAAIGARYVAALGASFAALVRNTTAEGVAEVQKKRLAAAQALTTNAFSASVIPTQAAAASMGVVTLTATQATGALTRMQIVMIAARGVAARTGAAMLAAFGGPVGLAITAIVAAVYIYQRATAAAAQAVEDFNTHQQAARERLQETAHWGNEAAAATQNVGQRAQTATTYQREFAGATGDAARALQDQARQARSAAIALQELTIQESQRDIAAARSRLGREERYGWMSPFNSGGPALEFANERPAREAREADDRRMLQEAERALTAAQAELARLRSLPAEAFISPNARTQGRDIAQEILGLQRDLVAANRANNQTAQREILKQIRLRQRITELMGQGLSMEVANATASAEQIRTTRAATDRIRFTAAQADEALRSIGAQITSGARSPQHNREVGGQPNSFHLRNQARDIAKTPGMSLARIRQAIESRGGRIVELLDEGDHFHVAWRNSARAQADVAEEMLRNQERFQSDLQSLQDDILQAQGDQLTDAGQIAVIERQRITTARDRQKAEIENRVGLGQLNEAQAAQLLAANETLRTEQMRALALRESERQAQERHEIATALLTTQEELLRFESGMATTAAERRRLELRALDVARQIEALALDRIIASRESTAAERAIAEARKADLDEIYRRRRADSMRQTRGPLEEYLAGLPRSIEEVNEALERLKVDQLEDLNRRTMEFADNFAGAFGRAAGAILQLEDPIDIIKGLLSDLAQSFTAEFVERPITDWMRRRVAGPLAERLVGGQSGPGGLDAAQINAAYQAGILGVTNFAQAVNAATIALQATQTAGVIPLGTEAGQAATALKAQVPAVNQFGGALGQLLGALGGGGQGGIGSFLGIGLNLAMSAFGGPGGIGGGIGGGIKIPGKAGGGPIYGAGTGTSDDVLIRASTGEYMIREAMVRKHRPLIEAINADRLPGFRKGGLIGGGLAGAIARGPRPISFGDIIVKGGGDERSNRRTAKQISGTIRRELATGSRTGIAE